VALKELVNWVSEYTQTLDIIQIFEKLSTELKIWCNEQVGTKLSYMIEFEGPDTCIFDTILLWNMIS